MLRFFKTKIVYNHYIVHFLASHRYRSVEPIYKLISTFLDYDEFCTNEEICKKSFER